MSNMIQDIDIPIDDLIDRVMFFRVDNFTHMVHLVIFHKDNETVSKLRFEDAPDGAKAVYDHFIDKKWVHEYHEPFGYHTLTKPIN